MFYLSFFTSDNKNIIIFRYELKTIKKDVIFLSRALKYFYWHLTLFFLLPLDIFTTTKKISLYFLVWFFRSIFFLWKTIINEKIYLNRKTLRRNGKMKKMKKKKESRSFFCVRQISIFLCVVNIFWFYLFFLALALCALNRILMGRKFSSNHLTRKKK